MTDTAPDLFAQLDNTAGVLTVRLVGPAIGEREGEVIFGMIDAAVGAETRAVVLDFADIGFINSAGLGACVRIQSIGRAKGIKIILYRMTDAIASVFKMSRLDKLFVVAAHEKALGKALKR